MTNTPAFSKALFIYGILIPVALLLGFLLATPTQLISLGLVGLVGGILCVPVLLRWHQPLLILAWNASINVFFLPGQPKLWMPLALISLGITFLTCILNRDVKFVQAPMVTRTLLALLLVVFLTNMIKGGVGVRALGSETYGGKGFFLIVLAIAGYFAISAQRIPIHKANRYLAYYFLGSLTLALSNLIYSAGPEFWWFFYVFPADFALSQAAADFGLGPFSRFGGVALAMVGAYCLLMARYGIRGILDFRHPLRFALWMLTIVLSMFGGFRSILVLYVFLFAVQFFLEGLHRTRLLPGMVLAGILSFSILIPIAHRLPLPMQRTLSLLPLVDVNPVARMDAFASTEWRLRMWGLLWPEVPKYLLLGRGFSVNPTDLYLAEESRRRGFAEDYEVALLAGDYHSGPLSILIPLGLPGFFAFLAFTVACLRVLYLNYRYGDPRLRLINTALFSLFIARSLSFWLIFGGITASLAIFTGLIGLSVALNGGVSKPSPASASPQPESSPQLA